MALTQCAHGRVRPVHVSSSSTSPMDSAAGISSSGRTEIGTGQTHSGSSGSLHGLHGSAHGNAVEPTPQMACVDLHVVIAGRSMSKSWKYARSPVFCSCNCDSEPNATCVLNTCSIGSITKFVYLS